MKISTKIIYAVVVVEMLLIGGSVAYSVHKTNENNQLSEVITTQKNTLEAKNDQLAKLTVKIDEVKKIQEATTKAYGTAKVEVNKNKKELQKLKQENEVLQEELAKK